MQNLIRRQPFKRGKRHSLGYLERLAGRQSDDPPQGEPVLGKLILLRQKLLLLRLQLDLRAQFVDRGRHSRAMLVASSLVQRLGRVDLRPRGVGARPVGDDQQVRRRDGLHHQIPAILVGKLRCLQVLGRRLPVLPGGPIENGLRRGRPNIGESNRSDDRRESRETKPESGQINLRGRFRRGARHVREQRAQRTDSFRLRALACGLARQQPQIRLQTAIDCVLQRERERSPRRLPGGHASLKLARRRVISPPDGRLAPTVDGPGGCAGPWPSSGQVEQRKATNTARPNVLESFTSSSL